METLSYEEITQAIHDYIRENYGYDYADVFEDEIDYHLGKKVYTINVTIDVESEME